MGLFDKFKRNVRKAVRKVARKPAVRRIGETVSDATRDVARGAGKAVETAGEFIGDTERFMKTGDWGGAVQTLQREEAEAEDKMWKARAAFDAAMSTYVQLALKRKSLSLLHEQDVVTRGRRIPVPDAPDAAPDLYGSTTTRALDSIGLGVIGDAGRAVQKHVPFRLPHDLLSQQAELKRARKLLNRNIRAFRNATAETSRATADVLSAADRIAEEVEALEDDFLRRGLDPETGATKTMADDAEREAKRDIARDLISAGLGAETVADATGLELAAVEALADAA
jgi:hypothetical protein